MADLLTHVMVGYTIGTILSWKYEWIKSPHVTMMMAGAALPDIVRIGLLIDSAAVQTHLGIPFSWTPLHTGGGVMVTVLIFAALFEKKTTWHLFLVILIGAASHLFLDALLLTASGTSYAIFWPLTRYRLSTPGLYLSTDVLPAMISTAAAFLIWRVDEGGLSK